MCIHIYIYIYMDVMHYSRLSIAVLPGQLHTPAHISLGTVPHLGRACCKARCLGRLKPGPPNALPHSFHGFTQAHSTSIPKTVGSAHCNQISYHMIRDYPSNSLQIGKAQSWFLTSACSQGCPTKSLSSQRGSPASEARL